MEHISHLHITKTCLTGLAKIPDLDDGKHVQVNLLIFAKWAPLDS
jgi:hypothetical protein